MTVNFSILVAGILLFFCLAVYFFYKDYRQREFTTRLQYTAINTATLLIDVPEIDSNLLKVIDENTISNMTDVTVIVLDSAKQILYSHNSNEIIATIHPQFRELNWERQDHIIRSGQLYLCFPHFYQKTKYYVLATATDLYGHIELSKLLYILCMVYIFSILLIVVAGFYNANQSLKPITGVIREVNQISPYNLGSRLSITNDDEIGILSQRFNIMLDRLEEAFDTERMFVSNASHELRTPVTSMKGQIEVTLVKSRSENEYRELLLSILEDLNSLATIINGFLELAETSIMPDKVVLEPLRIDELIFTARDEITKREPQYHINIDYERDPEEEEEVTICGNSRLLQILFVNLIDNSCKFSETKTAVIRLVPSGKDIIIKIIDNGIGIPVEELAEIVKPLYRAKNVGNRVGHGIGLSIVRRIADIHKAQLIIDSVVNSGTTVSIIFHR